MARGAATVLSQLVDFLISRPEVRRAGRKAVDRGVDGADIGFSFRPNAPPMNIDLTREQGWALLTASPALLIAGSLFRGL